MHGTDHTALYFCCESGPRRYCVHDEIHTGIRCASKEENVDVDMLPLRECAESREVERRVLSAYGFDTQCELAMPERIKIAAPVDMPLTWAQARPYVTEVVHDVDDAPLVVATASVEQFSRFLRRGPAGQDDLRFHELARALAENMRCKTLEERAATLLEIKQRIKCSHGYTAPHNPLITGLLRCNTAMKLCFNTQSAAIGIFFFLI